MNSCTVTATLHGKSTDDTEVGRDLSKVSGLAVAPPPQVGGSDIMIGCCFFSRLLKLPTRCLAAVASKGIIPDAIST